MRDFGLVVLIFFFLIVYADANCRRTFNCAGNRLKFPLSDKVGCGLLTVNCSDGRYLRVQLEAGGQWYRFYPQSAYYDFNSKTYAIEVVDHQLEDLKYGRNCSEFRNISLPKTQSWASSVEIIASDTTTDFLSCKQSLNRDRETIVCEHYLYHRADNSGIPESCVVLSLPSRPAPNLDDLLQMLTPVYRVKWAFSDGCAECLDRGQMCEVDNEGQSTCLEFEEKGSKKKIAQIVAPVVCGCAILLGLCTFLIYRHKKRINGAHLLSRDISFDPSAKPDVEGGKSLLGVPVFPYAELEQATKNFDPSKELGDGGFGTVYYGKLSDGREVAIKRLYEHNYRRVEQFLNEINILTRLRHPNLVTLYGCTSRRSQELLLVYEYIPNGTIADHLHGQRANKAHLSWPIRMKIAIETASALLYLHKKDIIHRDVKTHNILLDNNFGVKVADFGLSRLFPTDVTHISTAPQGTPGYVDPEYHQCYQLTDKSDVYSFGVVLIELISTLPAVDITRHRHEINLANLALNRIQRCAFEELIDMSLGYKSDAEVERMTTSVAELAFRCLQHDKDLRPSMEEVFVMLTDIQAGDDSSSEMSKDGISNLTEPGKRSASPTTDDLVRLKTSNLQSA